MNFAEVLTSCSDPNVGAAVLDALERVFKNDVRLLELNVSEEAVAAKLANYLQAHFEGLDVDVEYNRMGNAPKKVAWSGKPEEVYPDIIVHRRGKATNILAIELKKDSNAETKEKDVLKLKAYVLELGYRHALFMRLGVKAGAGEVSECEWVVPED